jgi:hypothetical protein
MIHVRTAAPGCPAERSSAIWPSVHDGLGYYLLIYMPQYEATSMSLIVTPNDAIVSIPIRGWIRILRKDSKIDRFDVRFQHYPEQLTSVLTGETCSIFQPCFEKRFFVVK